MVDDDTLDNGWGWDELMLVHHFQQRHIYQHNIPLEKLSHLRLGSKMLVHFQ